MKSYTSRLLPLLVTALALHVGALQAQGTGKSAPSATASAALASELVAYRVVVREDGKEAREPAATVKPGDLIEYVANYQNKTRSPLSQFSATLPIPAGTVFVAASGQPNGALASVDGAHFEPMPLRRKAVQPDGRQVEVLVPLSDYRALRWPARSLGAQERFDASLRVRVLDQPRIAVAPNDVRKP